MIRTTLKVRLRIIRPDWKHFFLATLPLVNNTCFFLLFVFFFFCFLFILIICSLYLVLGPVNTYPFSFENATFSLRIRLPSTRIRWKRSMKREFFENTLQSGTFWKRCFPVYVWTDENRTFRERWRHTISSNLLRTILKTYSRWRTDASLCCLLCFGLFLT